MIMFDDPKYKMNYEDIVVWNDKEIRGFFGEWRFLSNFHVCPVWFEGLLYPSSEAAYMAAKTTENSIREKFLTLTPREAKTLGRTIKLRNNWDRVKYNFMLEIVFNKFLKKVEKK